MKGFQKLLAEHNLTPTVAPPDYEKEMHEIQAAIIEFGNAVAHHLLLECFHPLQCPHAAALKDVNDLWACIETLKCRDAEGGNTWTVLIGFIGQIISEFINRDFTREGC
jgi:hypothetical protein